MNKKGRRARRNRAAAFVRFAHLLVRRLAAARNVAAPSGQRREPRRLAAPRGRMSAVKRRVFNALAAGSLVLFLFGVLGQPAIDWPPTYARRIEVAGRWIALYVYPGEPGLRLEVGRPRVPSDDWHQLRYRYFLLGFLWSQGISHDTWRNHILIPYWFFAAMTLPVPLLWAMRWREKRRRERNLSQRHCPSCGYDLRATPHRCPECGTLVESVA
jgi:hypothetical protein